MFESSTLTLDPQVLSIAAPLLPSLSTLRQSSGTLTFNNGQLTSRFNTPSGETNSTVSISQLTTDVSTALQQLQGTLTFDRGSVTSDLTTPSGTLTGTVPFAQSVSSFVDDIVRSFSGNVPFSDGKLNIDIPTPFGQIAGTIEFGNGALVSNLDTPLGSYFSSIDFREQDQFPFTFSGLPGVVNFNDGLVILDLVPQTQGEEIAVPINALSGNIAFNNGQATLSIPTPLGSFSTNFDLSTLVAETVTDALNGSGTVTFTNGIAAIDVSGGLGTVRTTLNLPQLAQDFGTLLVNSQGTISFDRGIVTSNLVTPEGNLAGTIDLSALIG
ncbi:hypothetical protein LEP3755_54230 [Leptolyngbya sp. NIES-3755]|nr:hypothetical protein LEP3755_54230 [Leptolyngbya sp. NIES-3755]